MVYNVILIINFAEKPGHLVRVYEKFTNIDTKETLIQIS